MFKQFYFIVFIFISFCSVAQKKLSYSDKDFSFTLLIDSTLTADSVNYHCVVKSIVVRRIKDDQQVQVLTPGDNFPNCDLPKDQIFIIEDVNFDGHDDIRLLQFLPAAPNLPYYFWTYNSATKKFQPDQALEEITSPEFDQKKKLIYSFWRDGCCSHGLSTFKYINGKPKLIEESEVKQEDGKVITTLKKMVNGKMKLVKKTVEKDEE